MPGADGLTLAQSLKALDHPPVLVFVTAYAEHAVQAFELEATDYLTKPVRLERLQSALHKAERLLKVRGTAPVAEPEDVLIIQDRNRTERVQNVILRRGEVVVLLQGIPGMIDAGRIQPL